MTYNRGQTPSEPAGIPAFLRKELEKLQRAIAALAASIASIAWSSITGTPTTLAGYGITDAVSLQTRSATVITTAVLADLASEASNKVLAFTAMELMTLQVDRACWVRFYSSAAAQTADNARDYVTLGTAGTGLLGEFKPTVASTISVSPDVTIKNDEGPPTVKRVWYTIQNRSGGASTVTVTMNMIPLEP